MLVIIGLIVGGILVGKDLIEAGAVRAQISQIEKYNTAVYTFKSKYNCLPGDCADAAAFGFPPRGMYAGQGDGNGILEGVTINGSGYNSGQIVFGGETVMFWVDLSQAELVDGGFTAGSALASPAASVTAASAAQYLPVARLGNGNYICVYSGGWKLWDSGRSDNVNYFSLAAVVASTTGAGFGGMPRANTSVTVQQAYNIDQKIDDGLPQSGRVMAMYVSTGNMWAAGGNPTSTGEAASGDFNASTGGPVTSAGDIGDGMVASPNSCYDGSTGLPEKYSLNQNSGMGLNCALSFQFQ